jgi:hypothetical protein
VLLQRGIDFHKLQPLFVSGGDDYKIKVSFSILPPAAVVARRCLPRSRHRRRGWRNRLC